LKINFFIKLKNEIKKTPHPDSRKAKSLVRKDEES